MKVGMILGLIGGVLALLTGALNYGAASFGSSVATAFGATSGFNPAIYLVTSLVLPAVCLVGAGIVPQRPEMGALLMAGAALGFLLFFGFGVLSIITTGLAGVGALLVWLELPKSKRDGAKRALAGTVSDMKARVGSLPAPRAQPARDTRTAHTVHNGVRITRRNGRIYIGSREFPSLDAARAHIDGRRS